MWDIDEQIRRIYENPYEKTHKAVKSCCICGEKIYMGDEYYNLLGKDICTRCISESITREVMLTGKDK